MPAENIPEAYIPQNLHSYLMHHIQSSYKTIPYTINIGSRALTSQLQSWATAYKDNSTIMPRPKNNRYKNSFGKKYDRKSR